MRVLLADDHSLLLEGLQNLLDGRGIEVVGTARDGLEAVEAARALKPDVVLMDVRMPNCDGIRATRLIKAEMPEVKVVMLTTSTEEEDLFEAVKSGANGYLLKSMSGKSLVEALNDVQEDIPPFAPGLAARLLIEFARVAEPPVAEVVNGVVRQPGSTIPLEPLTRRQSEVLALVAQGLSYKEVGARVSLATCTVKYHMAEIMQKLHVQNRAQLLAVAARMKLGNEVPD
jgi:two-component system NarL family response regulator